MQLFPTISTALALFNTMLISTALAAPTPQALHFGDHGGDSTVTSRQLLHGISDEDPTTTSRQIFHGVGSPVPGKDTQILHKAFAIDSRQMIHPADGNTGAKGLMIMGREEEQGQGQDDEGRVEKRQFMTGSTDLGSDVESRQVYPGGSNGDDSTESSMVVVD